MRQQAPIRKWRCTECGTLYDHEHYALVCCAAAPIQPVSICACGDHFPDHDRDMCPVCESEEGEE